MDGIIGLDHARTWRALAVPVTPEHRGPEAPGLEALADAELVRAAAAGQSEAFDQLVVRHQRSVYLLCYRFAGNHEDAADLAQDVFLRAYRAIDSFKGESAFATWLYRIGVNVCLSKASRRAPVTEPFDENSERPGRAPDAASQLLAEERAGLVRAAIAKLPARQRAAVILRVYQELSHEEIAAVLGSSVGAVKANFFHALRSLRRLLGGEP